MTKREVAELACRILALYYFVVNLHAIISIPFSLWGALLSRGNFAGVGMAFLTTAIGSLFILGVVWFLWARSGWIAEKIVPQDANYSRWPRIRSTDLQVVAFSVIGLMTLIEAVGYLSRSVGGYLSYLFANNSPTTEVSFLNWLLMENTLASLVSISVGLWLILGSRGIVRLVRRLQRPQLDGSDERAEAVEPQTAKGESN